MKINDSNIEDYPGATRYAWSRAMSEYLDGNSLLPFKSSISETFLSSGDKRYTCGVVVNATKYLNYEHWQYQFEGASRYGKDHFFFDAIFSMQCDDGKGWVLEGLMACKYFYVSCENGRSNDYCISLSDESKCHEPKVKPWQHGTTASISSLNSLK